MDLDMRTLGGWLMSTGAVIFFLSALMPGLSGIPIVFSVACVLVGLGVLAVAHYLISKNPVLAACAGLIAIGVMGEGIFYGDGTMNVVSNALALSACIITAGVTYKSYYARLKNMFIILGVIAVAVASIAAYAYFAGADLAAVLHITAYPFFLWSLFFGILLICREEFKKRHIERSRALPKRS